MPMPIINAGPVTKDITEHIVGAGGGVRTDRPSGATPYGSFDAWKLSQKDGGAITRESDNVVRGVYPPNAGGASVYAQLDLLHLNTREIFIQFQAKMPNEKYGCKFLKIFGERADNFTNYANTTFQLNYTGGDYGSMHQISFGDGTGVSNDTQETINLSGASPESIGRAFGVAEIFTPQNRPFSSADWGTEYHDFRIHVKFNSGNTAETEVADGEYYLEIDGKVYVSASKLLNKHWSNGPISSIRIFEHTQGDSPAGGFELSYKNPIVSTTGFTL